VNRIYLKSILRSVKSSFGRFAAIFAISALGVGFLAGLMAATPDMAATGTAWFDEHELEDIKVISNVGLDDDDVQALRKVEGISAIEPRKTQDILFTNQDGVTIAVKVYAADDDAPLSQGIDRLKLSEGRLPENESECLVESTVSAIKPINVGDTLTVSAENDDALEDDFAGKTLTVVGTVDNPYYMSMMRESTTIGAGSIGGIMYVSDSLFTTDYYTEIVMRVENSGSEISLSDEYFDIIDPVSERIEDLADTQKYHRHDKVVGEAREKIDDAWQEFHDAEAEAEEEFAKAEADIAQAEIDIADGKKTLQEKETEAMQEIRDAEQELRDAYIELQSGEKDYEEGLIELQDGKKEYEEGLLEFNDGLLEYEDGKQKYEEGLAEYLDGLEEYEDGKDKYNDGRAELRKAREQLEQAQAQIDAGYAGIEAAKVQLEEGQKQLDDEAVSMAARFGLTVSGADQLLAIIKNIPGMEGFVKQIEDAKKQIDDGYAEIEQSLPILEASQKEVDAGIIELEEGERELRSAKRQLNEARDTLEEARIELEDAKAELDDAAAEIEDGRRELEDARIEIEDGEKELADARIELDDGWKEYYDGIIELEDGKKTLREEIAKAKADIAQGERDLAEGKQEYLDAKAEAEQKLDDAEVKILDAEEQLKDIEAPKWYVLDRSMMLTPASFESNTEKVASIAKVFPVFFLLIAALVCLTTMTRMVEEERGMIGTMKALGYGSGQITAKYLLYALASSLTGSAVGLMIGFTVFPRVIWNAYSIMYRLPPLSTPFIWKYAFIAAGSIIACILLATLSVCRGSLKESSASLMLPKAPEAGKRVLLERIGFIWNRLSFNHKVTVRNLFRYKKRFFMTVIGVAGCTALMVTGFGLRDSIDNILHNQFDVLWKFDLTVGVKDMTEEHVTDHRLLKLMDESGDNMAIRRESGKVYIEGVNPTELSIFVPSEPERFSDFVLFRERLGYAPIEYGPGRVILTEKAANNMDVSAGDYITLVNGEDAEARVRVDGITENYVQGYIYVAPDVYEAAFGAEPVYNTIICKSESYEKAQREELGAKVLRCPTATSVTFTEDTSAEFSDTFRSIDMIVVLLIVCAGLLAFVVLYNLTNININERHKEIATLKVLGFFQKEVSQYILRETNMLTLIGALCGLGLGKVLHAFVAAEAEVDAVMFGRIVMPQSYLVSLILTFVFSFIVSVFMGRRLRSISMVESLKAPE